MNTEDNQVVPKIGESNAAEAGMAHSIIQALPQIIDSSTTSEQHIQSPRNQHYLPMGMEAYWGDVDTCLEVLDDGSKNGILKQIALAAAKNGYFEDSFRVALAIGDDGDRDRALKKIIEESTPPAALMQYLKDFPQIKEIALHLDNDTAGRLAAKTIKTILPPIYTVSDEPPKRGKDYNDYLRIVLRIRQPQERELL